MTVGDLIKALQQQDQKAEAQVSAECDNYLCILTAYAVKEDEGIVYISARYE